MTRPRVTAVAVMPNATRAMAAGVALRVRISTSAPMAAAVTPRSSLTSTRGAAQHTAAVHRPRSTASRAKASSGSAKAISWKSKSTAFCTPQDRP